MVDPGLLERLGEVPGLALRPGEPVARHSVWRVGGPVGLYVVAETEDALLELAQQAHRVGERLHPVDGLRWLATEAGAPGVYVRLGALAEGARRTESGADLGGAGSLAVAEAWAAREGLSGLEGLCGAGGTVAEAARAGALGAHLERVRVLRGTRIAEVEPAKLKDDHHILRVLVRLRHEGPARLQAARTRARQGRRRVGPLLPAYAFADPRKEHVAELLAELHLPGVRLRAARFGTHEPNCVINLGAAQERDIRMLLQLARDRAKQQLGVDLVTEITPLVRGRRSEDG